ncbi:MAG: AMP-binding protein [candidate division NC10 bacterium]|nr:AMP-binding protein [candidate division NC10 bacterium]
MFEHFLSRIGYSSYEDFTTHFRINLPERFNFAYDVVDRIAQESPDKPALVWCDDKGDEARFSFAEIAEHSTRAANFFLSLGIGRGDPVMLILKRRYEYWFCLLALHKIGAIAIPATHLLTRKDIVYRNNAASVKTVVAVDEPAVLNNVDAAAAESPALLHRISLGGARAGWLSLSEGMDKAGSSLERMPTENGDTSLLYFTSGTTGMPKMVQHDFVYPLGHILTAKYWQNVEDGGLHLTVADTGWAKAAWGKIYGQWICGSAVFVYDYDRFLPTNLLGVISKYKVTSFCAPPTIYRFFIKEDLRQYDFSALRSCVVAGEPLNPEVYHRFKSLTGLSLKEGYGQTEMTLAVAVYPWVEPKPGSMGLPSPGYDIDLLNEHGQSCAVGEKGEIVVRTDKRAPIGMFLGYHRDPELTGSVWHGGIYHTGDVAWRDEDGYLWFVGRTDDVIKSSGYRIGPFEVESALIEHPAVLECAVTGVADPDRVQLVKASVVLAKGYTASPELSTELQEHVKKTTAPYKYPRIIEFVTELPKTISGKIRRVEIRERDGE